MGRYVDGFVLLVKKSGVEDYKKMAADGGKIWKEHGALQYVESMIEDTSKTPDLGNFAEMTKHAEDEVVFFSFIVYESRAHRDEVNKKVMADPRMSPEMMEGKPMPFDPERAAFNGFEVFVDL